MSSSTPVMGWGGRAACGHPSNMAEESLCLTALMSMTPGHGLALCFPAMMLSLASHSMDHPHTRQLAWTTHPIAMHSWRPQLRTSGMDTSLVAPLTQTGTTHPVAIGTPILNGPVGPAKTTVSG